MIKDIIQIGDDRLFEISEPIEKDEISSKEVQTLAVDVMDTLKHHASSAAGLSAVQIGVLKRLFVVKRYDLEKEGSDDDADLPYEVLINPKIIKASHDETIEWEGCMSISSEKSRLYGPVSRSKTVKLEYLDLNGKVKHIAGTNFFAHLLIHELDHLDGKLFLEYIDNPKNIWKAEELDEYMDVNRKFPKVV